MATANPFDILGDNDNDDPSILIAAAQQQKAASKKAASPATAAPPAAAKLPTKPLPPAQAVRETRSNATPARGSGSIGRGRSGRGRGMQGGRTGPNRDYQNVNDNGFPSGGYGGRSGGGGGRGAEDGDIGRPLERDRGDKESSGYGLPRQSYRGGRRGGYGDGEGGHGDSDRPPRRVYERHSGTGRGYEMKREGTGRGNWGTTTDDAVAQEIEDHVNADNKAIGTEKKPEEDVVSPSNKDANKDEATNKSEEKEQEDKEMTLEEYEKIKEEKRKALLAMKTEERKADFDKDFESMKQLSLKKGNDDIFIKLGSDKDAGKRKESADRDERVKKSVSINEFLKPAEGEKSYGRGRGRGRGDRAPSRGGFGGARDSTPVAPKIEDPGQFPTLGGK